MVTVIVRGRTNFTIITTVVAATTVATYSFTVIVDITTIIAFIITT